VYQQEEHGKGGKYWRAPKNKKREILAANKNREILARFEKLWGNHVIHSLPCVTEKNTAKAFAVCCY
jgi:hypothetical protein